MEEMDGQWSGARARVSGKVTAACIVIAGQVTGELHCSGRLEITTSGRVSGARSASMVVVQEGAIVDGSVTMRNGI